MRLRKLVLRVCALAVVVVAFGRVDCGATQATGQDPPSPQLRDETGELHSSGFDALVESVERARRLRFVRRPELVVLDPGAPEFAALEEQARELAPIQSAAAQAPQGSLPPAQGSGAGRAAAFPDFDRAEVVASFPPEPGEVRRALARLLDGQHYPRLVEAAPRLPGDTGITIRALLAASASFTASGSWFPGGLRLPTQGLFKTARIEGASQGHAHFDAASAPIQAAVILLLALNDPETAFRSPPLSTKQFFSPAAYLASDRPICLVGALPSLPGCTLVRDESFGVLRLLLGLSASGGSVRGESVGRWKGDRLVQLSCDDGRAPWIYVAQFTGETAPRDFEAELDALLPRDLARPLSSAVLGPRITAWSGLDPELATAFARGLAPHEVHDFGEGLP